MKNLDWMCNILIKKGKTSVQAQANNLELDEVCPIELTLVLLIIPFMFIFSKHKGRQQELKGQCAMVPDDLDKIEKVLSRTCSDKFLISLALKHCPADKSTVNKQNARPAFVTKVLEKLVGINLFYQNAIQKLR